MMPVLAGAAPRFAAPSRLRKGVRAIVVAGAAALAAVAITSDRDDPPHWLLVARDSSYAIAIDTSRIRALPGRIYEVWYRTDHAMPRYYNAKMFTREVVHATLRCDGFSFRVMSVAMSVGAGRPVIRQTTEPRDYANQAWRRVEAGTTEADAARATCQVADWTKWGRR